MNCKDLEELLSAYADGELVGAQRDFIEEHLTGCADCRAILADSKKTREQLLSLRTVPPLPDIKQAIMSKIKMSEAPAKLRHWLRPALVGVPIIIALVTILSLHLSGFFISPASVIAKAYAATEKLESYRKIEDAYQYLGGEFAHSYHSEFECGDSDRYHFTGSISEIIVIGNHIYSRGPYYGPQNVERYDEVTPTKEKTLKALELLAEIETLPDEEIDGTGCYHYRGTVDMEKWLEWSRPYREESFKNMIKRYPDFSLDLEQMMKTVEEMWRHKEMTNEFWIGKDDYLIRQWKDIIRTLLDEPLPANLTDWSTVVSVIKYYDFNELIVIEPPLDESGELLEGWEVISLEE